MKKSLVRKTHPKGESVLRSPTSLLVNAYGGKVRVAFDDQAEVTAYGQLPFFSEFLRETGLFEDFVRSCPLSYTSNNAPAVRDLLGTVVLSVLAGHNRYAHMASLRGDGVAASLFGMTKIVSEDSARRGLLRIGAAEGSVWLRKLLRAPYEDLLRAKWVLDIDTTVKTIYGHQEGAKVGYNPHKHGRPSHVYHSYIMANTRLLLDVEVAAGNEHTSQHAQPGLWRLIDELPRSKQPSLLRGDSGFGSESFMKGAEDRNVPYLFKLRQYKGVKSVIRRAFRASSSRWCNAGQGWEGFEDRIQLSGWTTERRVLVIRRKLKENVVLDDPASKQLVLIASDDPINRYEHAVLVTSLTDEPLTIAELYRHRADAENIFDEKKNQWGWGGYTTHDLARCKLMARIGALVFNWWSLFSGLAFPDKHHEAITSRPLLLHAVGVKTRHAGQQKISVSSSHAKRDTVKKVLSAASHFLYRLRNAAEQLTQKQKLILILRRVFARFLNGGMLQGLKPIRQLV
jgi:Transposase DDE domain group 1